MIEQLADHGLQPDDLTPSLMVNARVKNPLADKEATKKDEHTAKPSEEGDTSDHASRTQSETDEAEYSREYAKATEASQDGAVHDTDEALPAYDEHDGADMPEVRTPSQAPTTENLDIDLRWTVLCDLFLLLISDSIYDSRSRTLLERCGSFMDVPWLDICRFEKRVSEALEMQDTELKEDLTEAEHMATRKKRVKRKKLLMMGLATVGGGLVIGLSAGLLAPVIGAGLVAGLGTIGVSSGGTFLAGVGGAALIGTTGALSGGTIGGRAAARRMGSVRTFEYRPLYNNRRVNLVITLAGWMTGKVDDVRLPYSTIDPVMGDIVSLLWEPEMLRSMGDTINILATEVWYTLHLSRGLLT
jgi:glutaredoxin